VAVLCVACTTSEDARDSSEPAPADTSSTIDAVATTSPGCDRPPIGPGVTDRTLTSDGVERRFELTVPADYDGTTPLPVVLSLHALTVPYQAASGLTGFGDMAPRYDFIGVSPSGRLDGATPYWLAAPAEENYDLEFFDDLLDLLEQELCVDPTRVYATGASNGGQMSSLLACRRPDRITAVAPVAGVEFYESCSGSPVPVMAFFGSADPVVTYDGGGLNATRIADLHYWKGRPPESLPVHHGVDAAMGAWAAHNGCDPDFVQERISPEVLKRTWTTCEADTILYIVDGGGHTWPGKPVAAFESTFGRGTTEIDASDLMFDFFLGDGVNQSAARPAG
jgi:polyhydroxybutyrate depolymerase